MRSMRARAYHTLCRRLTLCAPLAQLETLHLACRRRWQSVDELYPPGTLVFGEPRSREVLEFCGQLRSGAHARARDDIGERLHQPVLVSPPDDTAGENSGVFEQCVLQ